MKKENKLNFTSDLQKQKYLKEIISYFQDEYDIEIGLVAAEQLIDLFISGIGEEIYKKAILDCKKIIKPKLEDIEFELDVILPKNN